MQVQPEARKLKFELLGFDIQDEFPELAAQRKEVAAPLIGKTITFVQVFEFADQLQQIYLRAGYPLVRVVLLPQEFSGSARIKLRVIDGFIERMDLSAIAAPVRDPSATCRIEVQFIILKLLTLPYTYFLATQTVSLCQDQLYVSRTHDVVGACDEDGGYRAVCDRGDHHRRTIRRHGWSARGNAASLSRPGLCVSGPRSRFHFHFFERGCEPRTEQRYGDLSHGLCSDRPTTLDVAQHIPCICNVAGGRFGAQPRPMGRMVGSCSQRHRIHRLYLHRPAVLPR